MANLTIKDDKNYIISVSKKDNEYKINDEGAREALKTIQISLDEDYKTPIGAQLTNSPVTDDKFQAAIQKLNDGMIEYEAIHANALNMFERTMNANNHLSTGYDVDMIEENNPVPSRGDTIQEAIIKLHKSVLDLESMYANLLNDLNERLNNIIQYNSGNNNSNDISKIPTSKRVCIVEINNSGTLKLNDELALGNELHCIVINKSTEEIVITIPEDFTHTNDSSELKIVNGSYIELNIVSTSNGLYLINS